MTIRLQTPDLQYETTRRGAYACEYRILWCTICRRSVLTEPIQARGAGIKVVKVNEAYASQTCPACGARKKPTSRNYRCVCGVAFHCGGVGAIKIRQKYLGRLGAPVGIRLDARHCSGLLENVA